MLRKEGRRGFDEALHSKQSYFSLRRVPVRDLKKTAWCSQPDIGAKSSQSQNAGALVGYKAGEEGEQENSLHVPGGGETKLHEPTKTPRENWLLVKPGAGNDLWCLCGSRPPPEQTLCPSTVRQAVLIPCTPNQGGGSSILPSTPCMGIACCDDHRTTLFHRFWENFPLEQRATERPRGCGWPGGVFGVRSCGDTARGLSLAENPMREHTVPKPGSRERAAWGFSP